MPTTYNRATLSTFFQQNDVPQGTDYENMIYSQINIVDTSAQSMASPLFSPQIITNRLSAANIIATTSLVINGSATFNSDVTVSGNVRTTESLIGNAATIFGVTSAKNSLVVNGNFIRPIVTIAASGTTLGTANILTGQITRLTTVSDGTATGVGLQANLTGLVQYLYNETTTSANLWPCTGGQINVLASGAAFPLAGSTLYTIIHTKASGYAVK